MRTVARWTETSIAELRELFSLPLALVIGTLTLLETTRDGEAVRIALALFTPLVALAIVGCASTRVAQNKIVESEGQKFDLGGTFDPRGNDLTLTINGDPVLRGSFPPYTPTLRLNGKYKNQAVSASCYFGTVLGSKGGITGIVAGSIQGAKGKSGDKCDITVGSASEALFF